MRRIDFYKLKKGDNLADPRFWDPRFEDIDLRIANIELLSTAIEAAIDTLESVAVQRLNDTFEPLIADAEYRLNSFGVSFSAASTSETAIETGEKTFVVSESTRDAYNPTDYVAIRSTVDPTKAMIGQLISFERATGELVLDVIYTAGTGTYSSWDLRLGAPPDLTHATRTDNPHSVTAAQVGAYTTAGTDAAILAQAPAAVSGMIDDSVDAAIIALGLGALAYLSQLSIGNLSNLLATAAEVNQATASKVVTPATLYASQDYQGLTDGATIAWDLHVGANFSVTIADNRTLAFPSHALVGKSGFIDVTQPAGGNKTLSFAAGFTFDSGSPPVLDGAANRITSLYYHCRSSSEVRIGTAFSGVRA